MKKYFYLLVLVSTAVNSQSFQWLNVPPISLDLNPRMVGYPNAVDANGNTYVAGFQENPYSYGTIFGDVFFNKYDETGELAFTKTFTGRVSIYDIAADSSGNVLMAIGYVDFALIDGLAFTAQAQGIQPLLAKFDNDGNLLWHYIPVIEDSFEPSFETLAVDGADNIYIGYDNFQHSFIQKLNPDGIPQMTIANMNVKMITSIDVDPDGNIYAAGSCAEFNANFAGVNVPTNLAYNTWVTKFSPDGTYQWSQYVEDITCSHPKVKADTENNVYFSSDLYGAYQFGNITAGGPSNNFNGDFFLAKLNADGDFQWVREVPSTSAGTVNTGGRNYLDAANGEVVFAGSTRGLITWNDEITTNAQGFGSDALVLRYDSDGNLLMAKTFGGTAEDRVDGVSIDAANDLTVSGMSRGAANFDSFSHDAGSVNNFAYVGKISDEVILGNPGHQIQSISVWPNPTAEKLHFSMPISGSIFDVLGQKMMSFENEEAINISSLAQGVYLILTESNGVLRFVKS